jgi:hypothetical protein
MMFETSGHPFVDTTVTLPDGRFVMQPMHLDTGMTSAIALVADRGSALSLPEGGAVTQPVSSAAARSSKRPARCREPGRRDILRHRDELLDRSRSACRAAARSGG